MNKITPEFQKEIFKYLLQNKTSARLVRDLSKDIFTFDEHKLFITLLQKYVEKRKRMPTKIDFLQYLNESNKKLKIDEDTLADLSDELADLYSPLQASEEYLSENLISLIQYQQIRNIFANYAPILDDGIEVWEKAKIEFELTLGLSMDEDDYRPIPTSIWDDWDNDNRSNIFAHPSYILGLNRLTNKKGFATPELIILLGLPKQFKTGTMLNILVRYAIYGLNVFIADFENGQTQIRQRIKQILLEATSEEIITDVNGDVIDACITTWKLLGGSIWVGSYTANIHTAKDVEDDMKIIGKEEGFYDGDNGWGAIGWDYCDIMQSVKKEKEKRNKIENVYHDCIAVQKRQGAFGISASHTNRSAMGKFEPTMEDFSEDWGKAKNCHACFYVAQDEDEKEAGIARIGVVMQREGVPSGHFYVDLDIPRQQLVEIDDAEYTELLETND